MAIRSVRPHPQSLFVAALVALALGAVFALVGIVAGAASASDAAGQCVATQPDTHRLARGEGSLEASVLSVAPVGVRCDWAAREGGTMTTWSSVSAPLTVALWGGIGVVLVAGALVAVTVVRGRREATFPHYA